MTISLKDAQSVVVSRTRPLDHHPIGLQAAQGLCLAEDLIATARLPGFVNSSMDGYAVRAIDLAAATPTSPVELSVVGESRAGRPAEVPVSTGEAVPISTGAMLPVGADAVVRVEDTTRADDRVSFLVSAKKGSNVRRSGEDVVPGQTVLRAGVRLGPGELGVLAALGTETVPCHRRPRVAVVTTGDELVAAGTASPPGGIPDSNATMLAALIIAAGADVGSLDRVGDSLEATTAALVPALSADVVIICGGVSVGEHDHVKSALSDLGVERDFWRVALKPGGPTWFGARGGTLVFGLPGNPISTFVTFTLLVRPALAALAGASPDALRTVARLPHPYEKHTDRAEAVRCELTLAAGGWRVDPLPKQGSHITTSLLGADCLALIPAATRRLEAGAEVEIELLGGARAGAKVLR